jgi:proteasome lid subunit RPN8/RPN11
VALRVTRQQLAQILAQARAEAPNECCGLLLGRGETVEEVFPARNADESPRTYFMDPQDQLRAFRLMDERGWELVGIYHSHPQTKPEPSETDKARALYPDARYVIVSLRDPDRPEVRAWRILDRTGPDGAPVKDDSGRVQRDVIEEEVVVT